MKLTLRDQKIALLKPRTEASLRERQKAAVLCDGGTCVNAEHWKKGVQAGGACPAFDLGRLLCALGAFTWSQRAQRWGWSGCHPTLLTSGRLLCLVAGGCLQGFLQSRCPAGKNVLGDESESSVQLPYPALTGTTAVAYEYTPSPYAREVRSRVAQGTVPTAHAIFRLGQPLSSLQLCGQIAAASCPDGN